MIAAVYGETSDVWIITTLLGGLESMVSPFTPITLVTDNKTVAAVAAARGHEYDVTKRAPSKPDTLYLIDAGFPQARIAEHAKKLRIPTYHIKGD